MPDPRLEFGHRDPTRTYRDRPAVFGLAEQRGRLAVVRVSKPDKPAWFDLPGGAVDPGETEAEALVREFGEETGLIVRPGQVLDHVAQYFVSTDDAAYRNHGRLMTAEVAGQDPSLKIEHDHELIWLAPDEAVRVLRHDSHAWAVTSWLRRSLPNRS